MLGEEYLIYGLDALSRAHQTNYFLDGHRGAAMIAAYYFCQENDFEEGVADIIGALIEEHWASSPLCEPLPHEAPDPDGVAKVTASMEGGIGQLRQAGHNIILPTLALKAFHQVPEALTPLRVDGLCKLIASFTSSEAIQLEAQDDIPDLGASPAVAEFVLAEFLTAIRAFEGRGQGWSGHLLTFGRALLDLRALGYTALADKAGYAFKCYIKRIRMGPLETDKPIAEHAYSALRPHQRDYWALRKTRSVEIGHLFKYPYGFYGLMHVAKDADLKRRCAAGAYRIF